MPVLPKPVDPNKALKQSQNNQIDSSWIGSEIKTPTTPTTQAPKIPSNPF